MKLFLVALSLFHIVQVCYSGACNSLPPGFDRLAHGIDITSYDMFPDDISQPNGLARDIFDFTCDKGKKWTNPFVPSLVYDLPDQVESVTQLPAGNFGTQTAVSNNLHDTQKTRATHVGIDVMAGMFTLGATTGKDMKALIGGDKTLTQTTAHVSSIEVELAPYWMAKAGASLQGYFDHVLPNTYAENPTKYQEFLTTFGTHYFSTARFGGVMKMDTQVNGDYANKTGNKHLELNAGINFAGKFKIDASHNTTNNKTDDDWGTNTAVTESYFGGDANLITQGIAAFQNWWNSAQKNPWLYGGIAVPITNFLPEGPKKNALVQAAAIKLDHAYLDSLTQSLAILKQNPYIDQATANNLVNQVAALKAQPIPAHASVVNLGAAVENFVNVQKSQAPPCQITQTVVNKKVVRNCVNPAGATRCKCSL